MGLFGSTFKLVKDVENQWKSDCNLVPDPDFMSALFNMAANVEFHDSFPSGCSFFLKRKNRYCKMIPAKGKKYCGEHSYLGDEVLYFYQISTQWF